jgi:hypothetical protein
VEVQRQSFFTSGQQEMRGQYDAPTAFSHIKTPRYSIGGWVGPRDVLAVFEKRKNVLTLTGFDEPWPVLQA